MKLYNLCWAADRLLDMVSPILNIAPSVIKRMRQFSTSWVLVFSPGISDFSSCTILDSLILLLNQSWLDLNGDSRQVIDKT